MLKNPRFPRPLFYPLIIILGLLFIPRLLAGEEGKPGKPAAKITKPEPASVLPLPAAGDWGEWIFRMEKPLLKEIPFVTIKQAVSPEESSELRLRLTFIRAEGEVWHLRAQADNGEGVFCEEDLKIGIAAFWKAPGDFPKTEAVSRNGALLPVFAGGREARELPCIREVFEIKESEKKSFSIERWTVRELALEKPFRLGPAKLVLPGLTVTLVALGEGASSPPPFPYPSGENSSPAPAEEN